MAVSQEHRKTDIRVCALLYDTFGRILLCVSCALNFRQAHVLDMARMAVSSANPAVYMPRIISLDKLHRCCLFVTGTPVCKKSFCMTRLL